jgi:hypothetical protein
MTSWRQQEPSWQEKVLFPWALILLFDIAIINPLKLIEKAVDKSSAFLLGVMSMYICYLILEFLFYKRGKNEKTKKNR